MSLGLLYMVRKLHADIFKNGFLLTVQSRVSKNTKKDPRFRKDSRIRTIFGRLLGQYTVHMSTKFEVNRIIFGRVMGDTLSKKAVLMLKDRIKMVAAETPSRGNAFTDRFQILQTNLELCELYCARVLQ